MFELHRMSCQRCLQGFSLFNCGIRQNRILSGYNNILTNRPQRLFTVHKTNSRETITKPNFWVRWTAPREMPPRYTLRWYGEVVLICTVFGITGTSTMLLVRPSMFPLIVLHQWASFVPFCWPIRNFSPPPPPPHAHLKSHSIHSF